jgi:hypothetical protein
MYGTHEAYYCICRHVFVFPNYPCHVVAPKRLKGILAERMVLESRSLYTFFYNKDYELWRAANLEIDFHSSLHRMVPPLRTILRDATYWAKLPPMVPIWP